MRIKLKLDIDKDYIEIEKKEPISLEQLSEEYKEQLEYQVLLANVNNRHRELWYVIDKDSTVEFYDIRTLCAEKTFQHSLAMLYLKAANDVLGDDEYVTIENSLNQGFYSNIKRGEIITEEEVKAISDRMHQLVKDDIPFEFGKDTAEDASASCSRHGLNEKAKLLSQYQRGCEVEYYSLGGYRNYFYGYMVPSTKYLSLFELRKYRNGVLLRFPNAHSPKAIPEYRDDYKVYEAYAATKSIRKEYGVYYLADLNEKIRSGQSKHLIKYAEERQNQGITDLAEQIKASGRRIVMIAGPSSSGKTTFAKKLCDKLAEGGKSPLYLGTDDYFVEREESPIGPDGKYNFENLDAIDIPLFEKQMKELLDGKEVDIPEFDFMVGKKVFGKRLSKIDLDQMIVIEGIHCLNDELSKNLDRKDLFKIYISPLTRYNIDRHNGLSTTDARLLRRIVRDNRTRNSDAAATIATWSKVRAGEEANIFPYSNSADAVFNTSMIYETPLLKKYAEPLLKEIGEDRPEYGEALRLLHFLKPFDIIKDEEEIPANSLIREFIGGQVL